MASFLGNVEQNEDIIVLHCFAYTKEKSTITPTMYVQ